MTRKDGSEVADDGAQSRRAPSARVVLVSVAGTVLAVFALLNTDDVSVDWIFDSFGAPLIAVVAVSALLGFVIGFVARGRRD